MNLALIGIMGGIAIIVLSTVALFGSMSTVAARQRRVRAQYATMLGFALLGISLLSENPDVNGIIAILACGFFIYRAHQSAERERAMPVTRYFYKRSDIDGEWSNFAEYPIDDGTTVWATSEHLFQADKFDGTDEEHRRAIQTATTGQQAADLGRDRSRKMRKDWNDPIALDYSGDDVNLRADWLRFAPGRTISVKDYSMLKAVRLKVRQHEVLRTRLLASGNDIWVEHTKNDAYWADGGDGNGVNMLGIIIMIVRQEERRKG